MKKVGEYAKTFKSEDDKYIEDKDSEFMEWYIKNYMTSDYY